ncbi:hypothetical protein GCM10020254_08400 [Streptomyces goshikiensis]
MEQGPHVLRAEAEPVVGGGEQPGDVAVRDQRALGPAGGAGGVDDVREVVPAHLDGRGRPRLRGDRGGLGGQVDDPGGAPVPPHRDALAGQQGAHARVLGHEPEPLGRIGGVEGDVAPAGLEDAEDRDDQVGAAVHTQAHQVPRPDAGGLQMVGELVGAGLQPAEGEVRVAVDHRDRVRGARRPLAEAFVAQGRGGRAVLRRGRGRGLSREFGAGEQAQPGDGQVGAGRDAPDQHGEVFGQEADGLLAEEVGAVLEGALDALRSVGRVEQQVELGPGQGVGSHSTSTPGRVQDRSPARFIPNITWNTGDAAAPRSGFFISTSRSNGRS